MFCSVRLLIGQTQDLRHAIEVTDPLKFQLAQRVYSYVVSQQSTDNSVVREGGDCIDLGVCRFERVPMVGVRDLGTGLATYRQAAKLQYHQDLKSDIHKMNITSFHPPMLITSCTGSSRPFAGSNVWF
jgi:hypothetical protein